MRLKTLTAASVVVAALGAVIVSSAFAAATTTDVRWYTGAGTGTELAGSETISSSIVGTGEFSASAAGTLYELQITGINCVNCSITNSGGSAIGSGELEFTGVSVVQPAGCSVASTIKTKPLSVQADWMIGSTNYIKFEPTAGPSTQFATVSITGCPLATTLVPKGNLFGQSQNATGVGAVEQEVHFSQAINSTAGGSFKVGVEGATLTAAVKFRMSGSHAGEAFQTH